MTEKLKIELGDKIIHIRRWKGKDKKKFIRSMESKELNETEITNALVYDCIDENVALSNDEFKFVLSKIRAFSLGEKIDIEFYCEKCGKIYKNSYNISDVVRFTNSNLQEINVKGAKIKLGPIKNREFYFKKMQEDEDYDFLLRIEEINSNDTFSLDELEEIIDDLDISVLEEIMKIWEEGRFKVDLINDVKCSECGNIEKYEFDELPEFFPESWFK